MVDVIVSDSVCFTETYQNRTYVLLVLPLRCSTIVAVVTVLGEPLRCSFEKEIIAVAISYTGIKDRARLTMGGINIHRDLSEWRDVEATNSI